MEDRQKVGMLWAENKKFREALFTPDASKEANQARKEFLRTHPELWKLKKPDRKAGPDPIVTVC